MEIEKLYQYIITTFEGEGFQKMILGQKIEPTTKDECAERQKLEEGLEEKLYQQLLKRLAMNFVEQFFHVNSKKPLKKQHYIAILEMYQKLLNGIFEQKTDEMILKEHFEEMKKVMDQINMGCEHEHEKRDYTPSFLLEILGIPEKELKGKILELGCGKEGKLVKYLRSKNLEAYGLDMEVDENEFLEEEDWLQKDFPLEEYDVIFSHLAFSKHFLQEHLSQSGEFVEYASTYMKILGALKVNGKFYYTPSLDFIEELLPEDQYEVRNEFIDEENMRTIIKRLK